MGIYPQLAQTCNGQPGPENDAGADMPMEFLCLVKEDVVIAHFNHFIIFL